MGYNSITGLGSHAGEANTWLRFQDNNATTQITDSSGNGNHATLQGGRTTADLSIAGDAWSTLAMKPNGTSDYADFAAGTTTAFDGTEWTLVMRFKNPASAVNFPIFGKTANAQAAMFADNSGDRLRFRLGGSNMNTSPTNRGMVLDAWDGVVSSWVDGAQTEFLLQDGQSGSGTTTNSSTFNPQTLWLRGTEYSDIAIREMILIPRSTTATEREALMAGPEPLYTGLPVGIFQDTNLCSLDVTPTWDAQGNGTATTVYLWEVADDALGTNTQPRSRASRFAPSPNDAGKYVRVTVSGANPDGFVDDAETEQTAWELLTAAAPATRGRTAVVRGELNNNGSVDLTVPGFGNVAAAIFLYMMSDGTTVVERDSSIGWGFESWATNGAVNNAQRGTHSRRDDNVGGGTDYCWRAQTLTYPIFLTVTGQSWNADPITDGVRLTSATLGSDVVQCTAILFDENCQIEIGDVGAPDGQFDSVDFSFAPSIVFQASGCAPYTGTAASAFQNIGAFDKDGNAFQFCGSMERNNIPTSVGVSITNGDWARQYAYGSISWTATPSWANGGFTMDLSGGAGAGTDIIPWIAIGNIGAKCGTYLGPNSVDPGVGPFAVTMDGASNVTPETILFANTQMNSLGVSSGTVASTFGFGVDDGTDPHSYGVYQKRAASPLALNASTLDNANSQGNSYDGGSAPILLVKGQVTEFNSNEFVVDYTALGGNKYMVGWLAFGEEGPPVASSGNPFINAAFINSIFRNGAY